MQQNILKIVTFTTNDLYECPQWWINYVKQLAPLFEEKLMERLYNDWKVKERRNEDGFLELTFPSEEVYVQFLLTYS